MYRIIATEVQRKINKVISKGIEKLAKGRHYVSAEQLRFLLGLPDEVQIANGTFDPMENGFDFVLYSEKAIEGFTEEFKQTEKLD